MGANAFYAFLPTCTVFTVHPRLHRCICTRKVQLVLPPSRESQGVVMRAQSSPPSPKNVVLAADLTKWTLCVLVSGMLLYYRDATSVLYVSGAGLNSLVGKLLKKVIKQPRPTTLKADSGMPSSHAMSLSFLALLGVVHFWVRGGVLWQWGLVGGGVLMAVVASSWRIGAGYHTVGQVIAGWMLGGVDAAVWGRWVVPRIVERMGGMLGKGELGWGVVMVVLAVSMMMRFSVLRVDDDSCDESAIADFSRVFVNYAALKYANCIHTTGCRWELSTFSAPMSHALSSNVALD